MNKFNNCIRITCSRFH